MRDFNFFLTSLFVLPLGLFITMSETNNINQVYIVYMGGKGNGKGNDHLQLMADLNNRKKNTVVQIYHRSFLGFAARLSEEEAKLIEQTPGVVSVYPDRVVTLDTTHSWNFLMTQSANLLIYNYSLNLSSPNCESTLPSRGDHDTIIGILDTGIWPEHSSFNDKCMGPIPLHWKGICMDDENSTAFGCNKKVIGARYYDNSENPGYITTARDQNGHGTHVASIAAGIPVHGAAYRRGLAKGTARGGSPYSRLAVYNVCGVDGQCRDSITIKAFDDAIADGVDVISTSFSRSPPFDGFTDNGIYIGAFHAVEKGITVVSSVGNSGPSPGTVSNVAPWLITVGSTTTDRDFEATVVLGNKKNIKAGGINFSHLNKFAIYPLVDGYSARSQPNDIANSTYCFPGSLDAAKVKGNIVVCDDDDVDFISLLYKIISLTEQEAIGMIIINDSISQNPFAFAFGNITFVGVTTKEGDQIRSYIKTNSNPLATILPTEVTMNNKPAPVVAIHSSRGPIDTIPNLVKPDVLAPGINILGAWPPQEGERGDDIFDIDSGTSMACPHVSGLAAIVKSWHPTWSPSAIRSAIMTTAIHTDNLNTPIKTHNGSRATAYDMGAGEINLFGSLSPGLVYETETVDYLLFLCNAGYNKSMIETIASALPPNFDCPCNSSSDLISDMNYPSIAVSGLKANARTVKRTVTNVGDQYFSTYMATVEAPVGLQVQVVPNRLRFKKKLNKLSFNVTFKLIKTNSEEDMFGSITWFDGKHIVRSPFVAKS